MTVLSSCVSDVESVVEGHLGGVTAPTMSSTPTTPHPIRPAPHPSTPQDTGTPTTPTKERDGVVVGGLGQRGAEGVEEEGRGGGGGGEEEEVSIKGRRKLENADSSYDSDFDPNEREQEEQQIKGGGRDEIEEQKRRGKDEEQKEEHDDVYRTVSDTLGAEFAEYVTKYTPRLPHLPPPPPPLPTSTTSNKTITASSSTTLLSTTTPTTTITATTTTTTTPPPPPPPSIEESLSTTTTTTTTTSTTKDTTTTTTTTTISTATLPTVTLTQHRTAPKLQVRDGCEDTTTTTTTTTTSTTTTTTATATIEGKQRPSYASQVEFGVKLGYTETLVQIALFKLGATPDKDDLLAELIRLGTTLPKPDGGGGGGGGGTGGGDIAIEDSREELGTSTSLPPPPLPLLHHHHHLLQQQQQQQQQEQQQQSLRPVIIDGSNVAMSHGNKTTFSCRGLRVCVDWFRARGHTEITVFVPAWRKEAPRWDTPIAEQDVLLELERERILVFTPSRVCGGKRIVSYDDRYILNEAVTSGGVVVSNDNYRDLLAESPGFRRVVEENLLMYSWVNGRFVPPEDPLGRSGPTLDVFLRRASRDKDKQAPCPYGRKCTYGNKCKYKHPERGTAPLKSVTERLHEQAQRHYQNKAKSRDSSPGEGLRGSLSLPACVADCEVAKKPLARTQSIVPTVSLTLPSSLTQETPTHDHSPTTSLHHLRPPFLEHPRPLDPHLSATIYKSDSALYHLYPPRPPTNPYGSQAWGWEGGQGQSGSGPYGSHVPLSKQQSDPDPQDNPHRKLHRQLTLNPSNDSRLKKIYGYREAAPEHFPPQGSPSRVGRATEGAATTFPQRQGRASPGYSQGSYVGREQLPGGLHTPLARHSSQEGLPPHIYPSYSHPHVTRFASAPDPIWGGPHQQANATTAPPLITRINSTSDTGLNLYTSDPSPHHHHHHQQHQQQYFPPSDMYDDPHSRPPAPPYPPIGHPPPAPGPVGSRPMSPQGTTLHHSPSLSPRGHTPPAAAAPPPPTSTFPPPGHEDTRLRVFYHLSHLFPEAQVRGVMALHPEETDPQKICGYILAGGQGTSRPISPQHHQAPPQPSYVLQQQQQQQQHPTFSAGPPGSQDEARGRASYHLSQLFPEAEVRAVLATTPEHTDTHQFCAALLHPTPPPPPPPPQS